MSSPWTAQRTPSICSLFSKSLLTFGHEDVDGRGLRVGCAARVVARVSVVCVADGEPTLRLWTRLRLHGNSAP
jgi:hypothetical protein